MDEVQIASGKIWSLPVWGVGDQGQKITDIVSSIECVVLGGREGAIKIFSACEIAGILPGNSQIQARYTDLSGNIITSGVVNISVIPQQLNPSNGTAAFLMNAWQEELWLSFPGQRPATFYRAVLKDLDRSWPGGIVFGVIPNSAGISDADNDCGNTLPVNADRVACYFYAESNVTTFVIKNSRSVQINAQFDSELSAQLKTKVFGAKISVERAEDKEQFSVSYSKEGATSIFADRVETHYVFANQLSSKSSNFFRFKQNEKPPRPLKVTLFNYTHLVSLSVSWEKKKCTKEMMHFSSEKITCTIPTDDATDVYIKVDGNNELEKIVEQTNAPAATDGGTLYSLLVELM